MDKQKLKKLADYAVFEGTQYSEDGRWSVSYDELFYHFGVDVNDTNQNGKELAEELRRIPVMHIRRCTAIDIEIDSESCKGILYDSVILVHDVLRCAVLLLGLDGDGHAVLIGAADIKHILAPEPEIPDIDIGRDIHAGKMSDVDRAVRIRQRTGYERSFEILFHICL